jgi:hypothetical protein
MSEKAAARDALRTFKGVPDFIVFIHNSPRGSKKSSYQYTTH